jgi:hypothetical protein
MLKFKAYLSVPRDAGRSTDGLRLKVLNYVNRYFYIVQKKGRYVVVFFLFFFTWPSPSLPLYF